MAPAPPNVRRSNRESLPNTILLYRRQMIRENFCKTTVRSIKKKPNGKLSTIKAKKTTKAGRVNNNKQNNKKKKPKQRNNRPTKRLNGNRNRIRNRNGVQNDRDDTADAQMSPALIFDELTHGKTEKLDDTTDTSDVPNSFGNCLI